MSLIITSIVPVHVFTNWAYLVKPIKFKGKDYAQNVISFNKSVKIDIPGVKFGYDIETGDFLYKKDGGEWTPMGKEE